MSEPALRSALTQLLERGGGDWRALADLAVDFAPPHEARAFREAVLDPTADLTSVRGAIEAAGEMAVDDSPIGIGTIEPETLDFTQVTTISVESTDLAHELDFDFGAGSAAIVDDLEPIPPSLDDDLAIDSPEMEHDPGFEPLDEPEDDLSLVIGHDFDDDLDDADDEDDWDDWDDEDDFDVGD